MISGGLIIFLLLRRSRLSKQREGNGERESRPRLNGRPIIQPFPFSATIVPARNKQALREKYLCLKRSIPRAQVVIDQRINNDHQVEAVSVDSAERIPRTLTGNEPGLGSRPEILTVVQRREGIEQIDQLPPALETIISNRERSLRNDVENLRREIQMMRFGAGAASVTSPPTYRE